MEHSEVRNQPFKIEVDQFYTLHPSKDEVNSYLCFSFINPFSFFSLFCFIFPFLVSLFLLLYIYIHNIYIYIYIYIYIIYIYIYIYIGTSLKSSRFNLEHAGKFPSYDQGCAGYWNFWISGPDPAGCRISGIWPYV